MLQISTKVSIPENEIEIFAVRARGPGGQNVNKVATAIHLRFDIGQSSLPDFYKIRLLKLNDQRISRDGVVIIKAKQYRSQEKNREAALNRLRELIRSVATIRKRRVPTKPSRSVARKRLDQKSKRGQVKALRRKVINISKD